MFKAFGRLVKAGLTFDQLLSKYVKKGRSKRPAIKAASLTYLGAMTGKTDWVISLIGGVSTS
jgi:hypothetical protein